MPHPGFVAKTLALLSGVVLLVSGCATTSTETTWWGAPVEPGQARRGQIEWIRRTVQRTEGNPGAGAAAGAVVGGLLGGIITGRGLGAVVGAAGGAVVGAEASRGRRVYRSYDVSVRFEDGGREIFHYHGYPPFRPGELVTLTSRGLFARGTVGKAKAAPPSPQKQGATAPASAPTSPPPAPEGPPPEPPAVRREAPPTGEWVFTQQYGWVWMPYDASYTFTPDYENGDPYMYVYYPAAGWSWVYAPWLWGWGPVPRFGHSTGRHFVWYYGRGWGDHWEGHRSVRYRGGSYRYRGGFHGHPGGRVRHGGAGGGHR